MDMEHKVNNKMIIIIDNRRIIMRKPYLDFTMEQERKRGFEVYGYVSGLSKPLTRQSNLRKVIEAAWDDGYIDVTFAIGAHRRNGSDGWNMAVMVRNKVEINKNNINEVRQCQEQFLEKIAKEKEFEIFKIEWLGHPASYPSSKRPDIFDWIYR